MHLPIIFNCFWNQIIKSIKLKHLCVHHELQNLLKSINRIFSQELDLFRKKFDFAKHEIGSHSSWFFGSTSMKREKIKITTKQFLICLFARHLNILNSIWFFCRRFLYIIRFRFDECDYFFFYLFVIQFADIFTLLTQIKCVFFLLPTCYNNNEIQIL